MRWVTVFSSVTAAEKALAENSLRRLRIGTRVICLARTPSGYYAVEDSCPHRGVALSDGHINYLEEVVCPLHSYRYSLKNGRECDQATMDVETYPLRWQEGALQIGLS
ncbi:MAG TPA: Rieske (2Fe-2S) protein [Cytophagales bacterium]|nr:Rieske (2Fe-2S) protein [Cytophagales bacterium]HAA21951.1 Rieske (2Fe-2S) protein [Cytophagales bacterium]HAP61353.1 Rieske (2Fe-2S) protein [Cytophagales bacterium]